MQKHLDLKGKRIIVMGLGLHGGGLATTQWLLKHGAHVLVTDTKTRAQLGTSLKQLPKNKRLTLVLGEHRLEDFREADMIVQNPGVPYDSVYIAEARKNKIPIENEATLFFRYSPTQNIIGVTGSKGKSTTSTLMHLLLKKKFGKRVYLAGNIKTTPMLSIVDRLTKDSIVILELSSWQLEPLAWAKMSPHIAVVTNLLDDHLNRYTSRAAYYKAKSQIWQWQKKDDVVILNADNAPSRLWKKTPGKQYWFSTAKNVRRGATVINKKLVGVDSGRQTILASVSDLQIPGAHIIADTLAALLVAQQYHVSSVMMRTVLRSFGGVAHRLERIRTVHGVDFYNDTTATAPAATVAALHSFSTKPILIAGGVDKKLDYTELARTIRQRAKALILLPGTATEKLKKALGAFAYEDAASMEDAVRKARAHAQASDIILLSPGAASFGLFVHEFDRGDKFVAAVKRLR